MSCFICSVIKLFLAQSKRRPIRRYLAHRFTCNMYNLIPTGHCMWVLLLLFFFFFLLLSVAGMGIWIRGGSRCRRRFIDSLKRTHANCIAEGIGVLCIVVQYLYNIYCLCVWTRHDTCVGAWIEKDKMFLFSFILYSLAAHIYANKVNHFTFIKHIFIKWIGDFGFGMLRTYVE